MSATEPGGKSTGDARLLAKVTAVLTALVALNTLVISCSQRRQTEDAAAVARAQSEEQFWEGAMRDLDLLLRERPSRNQIATANSAASSAERREAQASTENWLSRCQLLSQRTVQLETAIAVRKSDTDGDAMIARSTRARAIRERAGQLQKLFRTNMEDPKVVGGACSRRYARVRDLEDRRKEVEIAEAKAEPAAAAIPDDPAIEAAFLGNQDAILMNRGDVNTEGYDIDVFWCDRIEDPVSVRANIAAAAGFARRLSDRADTGDRIANGRLGRIRLRKLSVPTQQLRGNARYPTRGIEIRYDRVRPDEKVLAEAMAADAPGARPSVQSFRPTPWYLSAFFCANP